MQLTNILLKYGSSFTIINANIYAKKKYKKKKGENFMKQQKMYKQIAAVIFALILTVSTCGASVFAANVDAHSVKFYDIANPYEYVNWSSFGQYKADFHAHSFNSDGSNTVAQMVEDHYNKGFDIFSMTDHSVLTPNWDKIANGVTSARKAEIEAGVYRNGKPMIDIDNCNEQSATDHINSFFADYNDVDGGTNTMAGTIAAVEAHGGITHINHAGRYTGAAYVSDNESIAISNNPLVVQKYTDLFKAYPSCIGMEIINKIDNESKSDRVLWDNILKEMMPDGRFVWGFSNDDSHSLDATGYSWNIMLMPEQTQTATRTAMETGAFYAVSRVSRLDGINRYLPDGNEIPGAGDSRTLYLLEQSTPSISNIAVTGNTITVSGTDYDFIEWIADGIVIATGNKIDLSDYSDQINSYVRAQLKSSTGIAFTQPFGVKEATLINVAPSASVNKLSGNQNDLTITVTEFYSNGVANVITETLKINNNATGTYEVGKYRVYVDTKGNDQIRACYIAE